jgi:hypothetical protein
MYRGGWIIALLTSVLIGLSTGSVSSQQPEPPSTPAPTAAAIFGPGAEEKRDVSPSPAPSTYFSGSGTLSVSLANYTGMGVQLCLLDRSRQTVAYIDGPPYNISCAGPAGLYYIVIYTTDHRTHCE